MSELSSHANAHVNAPLIQLATSGALRVRKAPRWSCKEHEYVVRYRDVAHLMKSGDASWYRGVKPWSMMIRCGTHSMVNHGGILRRCDGHIWNVDTCEGVGCRSRKFCDLVKKEYGQNLWSGQWYWAPVSRQFSDIYNGTAAADKAFSYLNAEYGHMAILFMAAFQMPVAREFMFLKNSRNIETDWPANRTPYCSALQSIAAAAGGVDPCPNLAWQLTSPQDTWQSLLWPIKIGLIHERQANYG